MVHVPSDTIADVADGIGMTNIRGSLLGDKAHSVIFDNTKIKTYVPGFKASITFAQGMRQTIDWFEADRKRMKIVEQNNVFLDAVIQHWQR